MKITLDILLVCCLSCLVLGYCLRYFADYASARLSERKRRRNDKYDFRVAKSQQQFDIIDDE